MVLLAVSGLAVLFTSLILVPSTPHLELAQSDLISEEMEEQSGQRELMRVELVLTSRKYCKMCRKRNVLIGIYCDKFGYFGSGYDTVIGTAPEMELYNFPFFLSLLFCVQSLKFTRN